MNSILYINDIIAKNLHNILRDYILTKDIDQLCIKSTTQLTLYNKDNEKIYKGSYYTDANIYINTAKTLHTEVLSVILFDRSVDSYKVSFKFTYGSNKYPENIVSAEVELVTYISIHELIGFIYNKISKTF